MAARTFEWFLQGEVRPESYVAFWSLLQGMADDSCAKEDTSHLEFVFKYDQTCPEFIKDTNPAELRVKKWLWTSAGGVSRRRGGHIKTGDRLEDTERDWELCYRGKTETKTGVGKLGAAVSYRLISTVPVSDNVEEFMSSLGFRLDFILEQRSLIWAFADGVTLEMFNVVERSKSLQREDIAPTLSPIVDQAVKPESKTPVLVEIKMVGTEASMESAPERIRRFAMDLEPYFVERSKPKQIT